jgi:hypothetical protein
MKTAEDIEYRLNLITKEHAKQHKMVEVLIAEKAPEKSVKAAKVKKLKLKDEIEYLSSLNID